MFGITEIGIDQAFSTSIMPIFIEIGTIIFRCSVVYGVYHVMRMQFTQGINQIKWAVIGYISLKMIDAFTILVDRVANNIHF
jgi:hypothetical protein